MRTNISVVFYKKFQVHSKIYKNVLQFTWVPRDQNIFYMLAKNEKDYMEMCGQGHLRGAVRVWINDIFGGTWFNPYKDFSQILKYFKEHIETEHKDFGIYKG